MIRDMYLLDAEAIIVQDPATNERRMIIKSKCGSKAVTTIRQYPIPCSSAIILFCKLTDCSTTNFIRCTDKGFPVCF